MFRAKPKVTDFDPHTGVSTLTVVCNWHDTIASFTKTVTKEQYAQIFDGSRYYSTIFQDDPSWTLADIELFFISGMCDDCWKNMCDEDDLEEIAAAEMAYADSAEMSYEELKREAITADRFDYDPEPYEESDEDYKS